MRIVKLKRSIKISFAIAVGVTFLMGLTVFAALAVQYSSLKKSAIVTVQSWRQEKAWLSLGAYPRKFVDSVLAIYDPDFKKRTECLSAWNQFCLIAGLPHSNDLMVNAHRNLLSHNAARMVQNELKRVRNLQFQLDGVLLTQIFDCYLPKDELLEVILNRIYMGQVGDKPILGFEAGSQIYFSKELAALSVSQIALLVAIPHSPHRYDPKVNPDAALKRRSYVLSQMSSFGVISKAEASQADKTLLNE